ncbi:PhzF family phenazine biosynthesis protein [Calothrix sp. 336/3]|uniref:PhzF family phenazine biosynthesis protein n=1 Tax=Calothrix sp. 336/3 TaxID=1337936 RepID=UPI0009E1C903
MSLRINYSETVSIFPPRAKSLTRYVKIFTLCSELSFTIYPTLGTAYIIQRELIQEPITEIFLNLQVGQMPVGVEYAQEKIKLLWMQKNPPGFG